MKYVVRSGITGMKKSVNQWRRRCTRWLAGMPQRLHWSSTMASTASALRTRR